MVIKDIYLAKIHFTNESGAKIRPVLLIRKNSFGDYVFLPLTSNLESKGVVLESTDTEHRSLPKKSVVLTEKNQHYFAIAPVEKNWSRKRKYF